MSNCIDNKNSIIINTLILYIQSKTSADKSAQLILYFAQYIEDAVHLT